MKLLELSKIKIWEGNREGKENGKREEKREGKGKAIENQMRTKYEEKRAEKKMKNQWEMKKKTKKIKRKGNENKRRKKEWKEIRKTTILYVGKVIYIYMNQFKPTKTTNKQVYFVSHLKQKTTSHKWPNAKSKKSCEQESGESRKEQRKNKQNKK